MHRVAKEFDYKSYAKRFSIDPITVISCLVGGGRCDREIVKYGFKKLNDSWFGLFNILLIFNLQISNNIMQLTKKW